MLLIYRPLPTPSDRDRVSSSLTFLNISSCIPLPTKSVQPAFLKSQPSPITHASGIVTCFVRIAEKIRSISWSTSPAAGSGSARTSQCPLRSQYNENIPTVSSSRTSLLFSRIRIFPICAQILFFSPLVSMGSRVK